MSDNKVNGKTLKNLIKEVLEEQRLDEKTNFPFDDLDNKGWKDVFGAKKSLAQTNFPHLGDDATTQNMIKSLGSEAGDPDDLELADIEAAAGGGDDEDLTAQSIVQHGRNKTVKAASDAAYQKGMGSTSSLASATELKVAGLTKISNSGGKMISKDSVTNWFSAVKKAFATDRDLAARLHKSFEVLRYINRGIALPAGATTAFRKSEKVIGNPASTASDLEAAYSSLITILNKDILGKDRFANPFGAPTIDSGIESKKGAKAKISQLKVKADSAAVEMFSAIEPGKTIEEKLNAIVNIATDVENGTYTGLTTDQAALEYANSLAVYNYISNMSKSFSAQAAGYEFEKVLALLMEGAVVGGSNGAADVVIATKGGKAYYSAKLLTDINDLKQSRIGKEGIDALVKDGPIYYIAGVKASGLSPLKKPQGQAVLYTEIYWYIFKVIDALTVEYLDKTGNFVSSVQMDNKDTSNMKVAGGNYKKYFCKMPILKKSALDKTAIAVGKSVSDFVDKSGSKMLISAKEATRKLQNMEANTIEYRAVAAKGASATGTAGRTAAEYVTQVANDFVSIKDDFKEIFKSTVSGASTADLSKFNESKKIITSDFLKKLIKETLKK